MRVWPGKHYPLGATWDGNGVNFAIFSECASGVELCLFNSPDDTTETIRIPVTERRDLVWHCYLPDVRPGQLYGYRVDGPYEPTKGHRFNANKIVLDPYAKGIGRNLRWCDELWGYKIGDPQADLSFDERDNAHAAPLAVVIDPAFTWGDDRPPLTTLARNDHLRSARERLYEAESGGAGGDPRYLRRVGIAGIDRPSQEPRRHGGRVAARLSTLRRSTSRRQRAGELLGLQHAWRSSPRT